MCSAAFILARSLPNCRASAACSFIVNTERCCRNGSSQSCVASELNWSHLYAICCCGQNGKVIDFGQDSAYCLTIPEGQVEFAQLYKYHYQSGKLVWKQHKCLPFHLLRSAFGKVSFLIILDFFLWLITKAKFVYTRLQLVQYWSSRPGQYRPMYSIFCKNYCENKTINRYCIVVDGYSFYLHFIGNKQLTICNMVSSTRVQKFK